MNEKEFGSRTVRPLLDRSSTRVDPVTRARLRDARERALLRYDARSAAPAFAWAGWTAGSGGHPGIRSQYLYWFAALLFAAILSGAAYWKHMADRDVSDVDMAILTDELPIEMYVD